MECNLCKSEINKILFRYDRYPDGRVRDILRCKRCGLVYRDSRGKFSPKICQNTWTKWRPDYPAAFTEKRANIFDYYLKKIYGYRKYNRILDVGSGYGYFLKLCLDNGWEVWGVEADPELVRFSMEELGIQVVNESFEEVDYPDNFFDVVSFLNVLEHIQDPAFALKKAYRILRPGGAIFLRFPNAAFHIPIRRIIYKLYKYWKGIRRLDASNINSYAFDSLTICRYLNKANFKNHIVDNYKPPSGNINIKELSLENVIKYLVTNLAYIVKKITNGKHLIASSLSVKAIKHLQ